MDNQILFYDLLENIDNTLIYISLSLSLSLSLSHKLNAPSCEIKYLDLISLLIFSVLFFGIVYNFFIYLLTRIVVELFDYVHA